MKISVIAILFLFMSCEKDRSCGSCNNERGFVNATIIDAGAVVVDGCDWLVRIGNDNFHADNLEAGFKQNNLAVKVCYEATNENFICGIGALNIPIIHIIEIKK